MSYFYSDLLRDYEKRTTKNYYIGTPLYLKLRSAPSAKSTLLHKFRVQQNKEATETKFLNGATYKVDCNGKQVSTKVKVNNTQGIYDVSYKPQE